MLPCADASAWVFQQGRKRRLLGRFSKTRANQKTVNSTYKAVRSVDDKIRGLAMESCNTEFSRTLAHGLK